MTPLVICGAAILEWMAGKTMIATVLSIFMLSLSFGVLVEINYQIMIDRTMR